MRGRLAPVALSGNYLTPCLFATLEDFLQGNLSGGRAARGDSRRGTEQNSHAAYIQDGYRFNRNLTINLGLCYDYFGVIGEERNRLSNFDLSIFKTTPFSERLKLQLRAEIFNLFNHPNLSSPLLPGFSVDASFNGIDPLTGRGIGFLPINVTPDVGIGNPLPGGGGSRNIQLALKLMF
jgi:hypothetical protein